MNATAVLADGRSIQVKITNLSEDGCQFRSDEPVGIGELVHLSIPPLDVLAGKIRWSVFGSAGVRFMDACA